MIKKKLLIVPLALSLSGLILLFLSGAKNAEKAASVVSAKGPIVSLDRHQLKKGISKKYPQIAGDFTIACWLKRRRRPGRYSMLMVYGEKNQRAELMWDPDSENIRYTLFVGKNKKVVLEAACHRGWNHYLVVHEGRTASMYRNGVYIDSLAWQGPVNLPGTIQLGGRRKSEKFGSFRGDMAAMAVFDRALSLKEIKFLVAKGPIYSLWGIALGVLGLLTLPFIFFPGIYKLLRRFRLPLLAIFLGLLFSLFLGEIFVRIAVKAKLLHPRFIQLLKEELRIETAAGSFLKRQKKTTAPAPEIYAQGERYYRNNPSLRDYSGYVTHDQYGFRSLTTKASWETKPKPDGPIRIAVLGDSMTWGQNAENDQTFCAVAQRWLERWLPGKVDLVNTGVPGFSVQHFDPYYRHQIRPFKFDRIIIAAFLPDFGRPQYYLRPGYDYFLLPGASNRWKGIFGSSQLLACISFYWQLVKGTSKSNQWKDIFRDYKKLERLSFAALKRLVRATRKDKAALEAFLVIDRGLGKTVDEAMTDASLYDKNFSKAIQFFENYHIPVVKGYEALLGYTTGQCYEMGRKGLAGHYSAISNFVLGKKLATYIYTSITKKSPPDMVPQEMPMAVRTIKAKFSPKEVPCTVQQVTFKLVLLRSGEFDFGRDIDNPAYGLDEAPYRAKIKKPFFIMQKEVTNRLWNVFAKQTKKSDVLKKHYQGGVDLAALDLPRCYINMVEAKAFALWLTSKTKYKFRVPTEEEWEWAAKQGYNPKIPLSKFAIYDIHGRPYAANKRSLDNIGLCDMLGNMAEIVIGKGDQTIYKGGCYISGPLSLRPAAKTVYDPNTKFSFVGLRLVATK